MIGVLTVGYLGFPGSSAGEESTCKTGDPSSIPGLGRSSWRRDRPPTPVHLGFPGVSDGKESACSAGDLSSVSGSGTSPGGGHGNPLQYSCLENPMDGGAWRATVSGVAKSQTRLSDWAKHSVFTGVGIWSNWEAGSWLLMIRGPLAMVKKGLSQLQSWPWFWVLLPLPCDWCKASHLWPAAGLTTSFVRNRGCPSSLVWG